MTSRVILQFLLLTMWAFTAQAVVVRDLQFESLPSGAEVYLLEGSRQELLGTTPLKYQAEFHSDMSILRFAVKKSGYESQTIEVNAQQDRVVVNLPSQGLAASASSVSDPELRKLQTRLASSIDRTLSELHLAKGPYTYTVSGRVFLAKLDAKIFLVVPVEIKEGGDRGGSSRQDNEEFLRAVWDQIGQEIVGPLALVMPREGPAIGMIIDIGYQQLRRGFSVSSQWETIQEMKCFPGSVERQVYDPCARMVYDHSSAGISNTQRCEGGLVTRFVLDPCAYKVSVPRSQVKVDPSATVGKVPLKAQYVLPTALIDQAAGKQDFYQQLGLLLTGENGEILFKKGEVPSTLPMIR